MDAVERFEERQGVPDLIALQSTDEMPARRRRKQRDFRARFLDAALAEELLTGIERGPDLFGVVGFGNRDQLDVVGRTRALVRRLADPRPDALEVLGDVLHVRL